MNKLLTDDDKLWKPRNKQAALVVRPASYLALPPPVRKFLPSDKEIAEAVQKAARDRIAQLKAECDEIDRQRALQPKPKPEPKKAKCMWAAKLAKRLAKQKGLPPPTTEELRKIREAQPIFGKVLHGHAKD